MKNIALIVILGLISFACNKSDTHAEKEQGQMHEEMADMQSHDSGSMGMMGEDERLVYYTCPMPAHKAVHQKEPGKCEQCGMELVPAVITTADKADYYGCPMASHSQIRHEGPGKCEDCGMKLMPMRLAR
ncbi:MAG: hypothetical protein GXO91_06505 [FCB group bacterium]|nr:hypothetical protein [FCB group bacterium]